MRTKSQLGWLNMPHLPILPPPVTVKQRVVVIPSSYVWCLKQNRRYKYIDEHAYRLALLDSEHMLRILQQLRTRPVSLTIRFVLQRSASASNSSGVARI